MFIFYLTERGKKKGNNAIKINVFAIDMRTCGMIANKTTLDPSHNL